MARALPLTSVLNKCLIACSRDATVSCSFWAIPFEFFTVIAALWLPHSILPSHRKAGARVGRASPISYRQAFWLLEPELRTRIFILLIGQFTPLFGSPWRPRSLPGAGRRC